MQYSPKLKKAMEQIRKILHDNEIAGFVAIHTPGFCEFCVEITPPYSCAEWTPRRDGVIIKGRLEHYSGDRAKQIEALKNTTNMLHHLGEVTGRHALDFIQLSEQADKAYNATHDGNGLSSHTQQNN